MALTAYPRPEKRKLTAHELETVTLATQERVCIIMAEIDADTWAQAYEWYPSAHRTAQGLAKLFGVSLAAAAGVIAALSPRMTWETNLDEARECFEYGEEWGYAALPSNVDKALDIIAGSDPELRLGGRKVRSFWRNIVDPWGSDDVTLDGWMVTALGLPGDDTAHRYLERRGTYDAIAEGFRREADNSGLRPHELQAAIWIHYRETLPRKVGRK